jgi:hypothetical protein
MPWIFIRGFKAAADSLSGEGMQMELRVFDSAPGKFKLQRMMRSFGAPSLT